MGLGPYNGPKLIRENSLEIEFEADDIFKGTFNMMYINFQQFTNIFEQKSVQNLTASMSNSFCAGLRFFFFSFSC